MSGTGSRGLTNCGDRELSLYLRRAFAKSVGFFPNGVEPEPHVPGLPFGPVQ